MRDVIIFEGRYPYKIVQIPEKKAQEHFAKGKLLAIQGKYEEAKREYEKALEVESAYKKARVNLDFLHWMSGPFKKLKD